MNKTELIVKDKQTTDDLSVLCDRLHSIRKIVANSNKDRSYDLAVYDLQAVKERRQLSINLQGSEYLKALMDFLGVLEHLIILDANREIQGISHRINYETTQVK